MTSHRPPTVLERTNRPPNSSLQYRSSNSVATGPGSSIALPSILLMVLVTLTLATCFLITLVLSAERIGNALDSFWSRYGHGLMTSPVTVIISVALLFAGLVLGTIYLFTLGSVALTNHQRRTNDLAVYNPQSGRVQSRGLVNRLPIPYSVFDSPDYVHLLIEDTRGYWDTEEARAHTPLDTSAMRSYAPRILPSTARRQQIPVLDMPRPAPDQAGIAHAQPEMQDVPSTSPLPPRYFDLASFNFKPSMNNIMLGADRDGHPVTCSVTELVHVAFVGVTGTGKTTLARGLIAQLVSLRDVRVYMIDPHFMPKVQSSTELIDWELITPHLSGPVIHDPLDAEDFLADLVRELERRQSQGREGVTAWPPTFVYIDEAPIISAQSRNFITIVARLLREGRKYGIFVMISAQDMLVKTFEKSSTGIFSNLQTVMYTGGDPYSARTLLRQPVEEQTGHGTVVLRNVRLGTEPRRLYAPNVTNAAVIGLLGDGSGSPTSQTPTGTRTVRPSSVTVGGTKPDRTSSGSATPDGRVRPSGSGAASGRSSFTDQERELLKRLRTGESVHRVASDLSGTDNGQRYQMAREEVQKLLDRLVRYQQQRKQKTA